MDHIFFIHSSVDGYLGYFCALAVVNSAAINVRVHASFQLELCSDICLEMGLLGHKTTLFLV